MALAAGVLTAPAVAGTASIIMKPTSGLPTTKVSVSGAGFGVSETMTVDFSTPQEATAVTSSTGTFSASFTMPKWVLPGQLPTIPDRLLASRQPPDTRPGTLYGDRGEMAHNQRDECRHQRLTCLSHPQVNTLIMAQIDRQAAGSYQQFKQWTGRHQLVWDCVGLDIEPDAAIYLQIMDNPRGLAPMLAARAG